MSDKKIKADPLLGQGQGQVEDTHQPAPPDQSVEPKVEVKPAKILANTVAENKDIVAQTKMILANGEHVNFIIPMADGEAPGAYETVQINGYGLTIQKGVMVNIPLPVANLLAEKYRIAMTAGQDKRIDRASTPDHNVSEALS